MLLLDRFCSEAFAPKDANLRAITSNGITYVSFAPPGNVVVSSPGYINYGVPITTTSILTASGDEHLHFAVPLLARRVGFDVYTINDPGNPLSVPGAANVLVTVSTTSA